MVRQGPIFCSEMFKLVTMYECGQLFMKGGGICTLYSISPVGSRPLHLIAMEGWTRNNNPTRTVRNIANAHLSRKKNQMLAAELKTNTFF
jgi:hypothetical protein